MNPFTQLKTQVRSALEKETKLSPEERKQHQWQFLTTVNGVTYIVGKGGANTMFYMIGKGERKICMPKEMLDVIGTWGTSKYPMYAICKKKGRYTHGPNPSLEAMFDEDPAVGSFLVGFTNDGRVHRLYKYVSGLMGSEWVEFKASK
jgi:hypothetical protein